MAVFIVVFNQTLDVANYLHQRYGSLDEQGRNSGTRMSSINVSVDGTSSPLVDDDEKVTPVPTLATVDASSRQHGQEAPLLLGNNVLGRPPCI